MIDMNMERGAKLKKKSTLKEVVTGIVDIDHWLECLLASKKLWVRTPSLNT